MKLIDFHLFFQVPSQFPHKKNLSGKNVLFMLQKSFFVVTEMQTEFKS